MKNINMVLPKAPSMSRLKLMDAALRKRKVNGRWNDVVVEGCVHRRDTHSVLRDSLLATCCLCICLCVCVFCVFVCL